jgi:hypothetical protein
MPAGKSASRDDDTGIEGERMSWSLLWVDQWSGCPDRPARTPTFFQAARGAQPELPDPGAMAAAHRALQQIAAVDNREKEVVIPAGFEPATLRLGI